MTAAPVPTHHPHEGLLLDYAAGSLPEPVALVVATHLALCPVCREAVSLYETVGGALLDADEATVVSAHHDASFEALMVRLDEVEDPRPAASPPGLRVPRPLRDYLDAPLDSLRWRSRGNLRSVSLLTGYPGYRTRLLRIRAGAAMPEHVHGGVEMTLVLSGGFADEFGHYGRGDISMVGDGIVHRPVADPGEECLCLAVTDAPLRLTGRFVRLLNPLLRF